MSFWHVMGLQKLKAFIFAVCLLSCESLFSADVSVFAAVSLSDALKEIAVVYEKQSEDKILMNFAASSTLARQIEEGAPADIFFSADEAKMIALERKGFIQNETRRSSLSNSLVIVVPIERGAAIQNVEDLASEKVKRLALAEPNTVPAGIYARKFLQSKDLWNAVERKIVPTQNVRAALAAVESGNVDAAIVYKTDAAISKKVKVACEIPSSDTPEIRYSVALVKESRQPDAAKKFLVFIHSREAEEIFEKFGFIVRDQ